MYRISQARNGYYYGQKRNAWGGWQRCTSFFSHLVDCRRAVNTLKRPPTCSCNLSRVVEYL